MRTVQLIDSLEAGGAERMAVNYANALSDRIDLSAIVATRAEGPLLGQIDNGVRYLYLKRKHTLDFGAVLRLRKFVVTENIQIIHAHSSSYFLAVLVKILLPKLKIIWHDHYGNSEFLAQRNSFLLKWASLFFSGIIVVNSKLFDWCTSALWCKNIIYLPNFVLPESGSDDAPTILAGSQGKRIICLANLRPQKGHHILLDVAAKFVGTGWTFHLVGKNFNDDYSREVSAKVVAMGLSEVVFMYGSKNDIGNILSQCDIGILTSVSEGLPVALLEYGLHKLPVVVSEVGEIPLIFDRSHAMLVPVGHVVNFVDSLQKMTESAALRRSYADSLHKFINITFGKEKVIEKYLGWTASL